MQAYAATREHPLGMYETSHPGGHPEPENWSNLMGDLDRITIDPQVCGGRPCIRGLRVRVSDILAMLASGAAREEILRDYPYLESEDLEAALKYAAAQMDHAVISVA